MTPCLYKTLLRKRPYSGTCRTTMAMRHSRPPKRPWRWRFVTFDYCPAPIAASKSLTSRLRRRAVATSSSCPMKRPDAVWSICCAHRWRQCQKPSVVPPWRRPVDVSIVPLFNTFIASSLFTLWRRFPCYLQCALSGVPLAKS
jgi:hypothetical protein